MERQPTVSSSSFRFLITPENVLPIARQLVALDISAFKHNAFSRRTRILQSLRNALHHYQSSRVLQRPDQRWSTQLEQEFRQLIISTREAVALLKPFARSELVSSLSTGNKCIKQNTMPVNKRGIISAELA